MILYDIEQQRKGERGNYFNTEIDWISDQHAIQRKDIRKLIYKEIYIS